MYKIRFIILITIFLIYSFNAFGQKSSPVGIEIAFGKGYNFYGSKTNKYFDNTFTSTPALYIYIGDCFFGFELNDSNKNIKQSIVIEGQNYSPENEFNLDFGSMIIGYKLYFRKDISFDPYIGIQTNSIHSLKDSEIEFKENGFCGGFIVNKYFKTKWKYYHPLIFFNNRFCNNKLSKINNELGDFHYSFDIGVGIEFGPKNERK